MERRKQAVVHRDGDRLIVEFTDDLQPYERNRFTSLLPQTIKVESTGRKLIIDNPRAFHEWLGVRQGVLGRIRGAFRR